MNLRTRLLAMNKMLKNAHKQGDCMRLSQLWNSISRYCITRTLARVSIPFAAVLVLGVAQTAYCDTFTINFETLPALPTQPNNFAAAGAMQTYSQPGIFSISGGVVLGNPTFLPAFAANGTPPNLYGTADFASPTLLPTITLDLPTTSFLFTSVSFLLFNGQPISETYSVSGIVGGNPIAAINIGPLASNTAGGFTNFTFNSPGGPITRISITPPNANINGWDFLVDRIVITGTPVPEPSSFVLLLAPIGGLALARYKRGRRSRA
jgi:hypothetical protein